MKKFSVETAVGIFLIIGFFCFAYLSVRLGNLPLLGENKYPLKARFGSISGLKKGATIEVAGVVIGKVDGIALVNYEAVVHMLIDDDVKLPDDTIASIRTQGIIGDKYIKMSPGGSDKFLKPGAEITDTESAIDIEELIAKYVFGKI